MDSLEELKNISQNSILMDELEEYCHKIALEDAHNNGRSEGEQKKSIEIAKRMLAKETDINFISECTGLSIEEIKKL